MDNEKIKQFIVPILLLIVTAVGLVMLSTKVVDNVRNYMAIKTEIETKTASIQEKQAKLDEYKRKEEEQKTRYLRVQPAENLFINLLWKV